MSRRGKGLLKVLGVLYFVLFMAFLLSFSRLGFHWYTRPRLIPGETNVPRRSDCATDEEFEAAKTEITRAGFRLRGPNAGIAANTAIGPEQVEALVAANSGTVLVHDPRLIRKMAAKNLVAGEEFRDEKGAICRIGEPLTEEKLVRMALAYDNLEGAARRDRIQVKGRGSIVGFDLTMLFAVLNFLVLVALLYAFLWEPVTKMLDGRAQAVREDIDSARHRREEADSLREEAHGELERIQDGADELREAGHRKGEEERAAIVGEAREEARRTAERTKRAVEAEIERARATAAGEIGELSVDLASKVLGRAVTPEDHERLVQEFIESLGRAPGSGKGADA